MVVAAVPAPLPVDLLKLAKPFVDGMVGDDKETALVCAILDLGANLGLGVVAEGIEHAEQAATALLARRAQAA